MLIWWNFHQPVTAPEVDKILAWIHPVQPVTKFLKCHYLEEMFITGYTRSCLNYNLLYSQWQQFRKYHCFD